MSTQRVGKFPGRPPASTGLRLKNADSRHPKHDFGVSGQVPEKKQKKPGPKPWLGVLGLLGFRVLGFRAEAPKTPAS